MAGAEGQVGEFRTPSDPDDQISRTGSSGSSQMTETQASLELKIASGFLPSSAAMRMSTGEASRESSTVSTSTIGTRPLSTVNADDDLPLVRMIKLLKAVPPFKFKDASMEAQYQKDFTENTRMRTRLLATAVVPLTVALRVTKYFGDCEREPERKDEHLRHLLFRLGSISVSIGLPLILMWNKALVSDLTVGRIVWLGCLTGCAVSFGQLHLSQSVEPGNVYYFSFLQLLGNSFAMCTFEMWLTLAALLVLPRPACRFMLNVERCEMNNANYFVLASMVVLVPVLCVVYHNRRKEWLISVPREKKRRSAHRHRSGRLSASKNNAIGSLDDDYYPPEELQDVQILLRQDKEVQNERQLRLGPKAPNSWRKTDTVLGIGSFAWVAEAVEESTGVTYAMKKVRINGETYFQQLESEVALIQKLWHPNVVQFVDAVKIDGDLCLFMEQCLQGTIQELVQSIGTLDDNSARWFSKNMTDGLSYLHRHGIAHRDFKTANCLIHDYTVKIGDLGSARYKNPIKEASLHGSPLYMAPETLRLKTYDRKCDIWALGCCVLEMTAARHIIDRSHVEETSGYAAILEISHLTQIPELPNFLNPEVREFLTKCLEIDPQQRPTVHKLSQETWVKNVRTRPTLGSEVVVALDRKVQMLEAKRRRATKMTNSTSDSITSTGENHDTATKSFDDSQDTVVSVFKRFGFDILEGFMHEELEFNDRGPELDFHSFMDKNRCSRLIDLGKFLVVCLAIALAPIPSMPVSREQIAVSGINIGVIPALLGLWQSSMSLQTKMTLSQTILWLYIALISLAPLGRIIVSEAVMFITFPYFTLFVPRIKECWKMMAVYMASRMIAVVVNVVYSVTMEPESLRYKKLLDTLDGVISSLLILVVLSIISMYVTWHLRVEERSYYSKVLTRTNPSTLEGLRAEGQEPLRTRSEGERTPSG